MVNIHELFFLWCITNSIWTVLPVPMQELLKNDIIIDVRKGYALRRIGTYSSNVVEQIVHTFMPLNQFCTTSPTQDVCLYTSQSAESNMVELSTFMASNQSIYTSHSQDKESASKLIGNDLLQVLTQQREIIKNNKSIVHFIDNQLHYQNADQEASTATSSTNTIDNYQSIVHLRRPTSIETILKQINNNKIGFDYLSSTDLKFFLSTIISSIDTSLTVSNIHESLNIFASLIVGQSVFVIRSCSLNQHNSLPSQPCLVVSTLFFRTPTHSASIFSIYYLIPLPTIFNGDKYAYSNLPKIIGINSINQRLIVWNEESDINQCTFSPVVKCQRTPISTPISKSSCLSQLFDDNQSLTTMCQVSRSQNIDQDVTSIHDTIWLFNNIRHTQYCHVYSLENELTETITINEPVIVSVPCDKKVTCMDLQLSVTSCSPGRTILLPGFSENIRSSSQFIAPIQNMTKTLLSSYGSQLDRSTNEVLTNFISKQSQFKRFMHDFASYVLFVVILLLSSIVFYILKLIRCKLQKELDSLEGLVIQMIRV